MSRARTAAGESPAGRAATAQDGAGWCADPYTAAMRAGRGPLYLRGRQGERLALGVERWCGAPDAADRTVIDRCEGAVLDIGCGPGRFVAALALAGHRALGIDVSRAAVRRTLRGGGPALVRSVFDPVPREGRWDTALLVDGNIGIGGAPEALLARAAELLAPGGLLVAEVAPADVDERLDVRFDDGGTHADGGTRTTGETGADGGFFPWARVGARALLAHADRAGGWAARAAWRRDGRCFVALRGRP
ncbi:class I SAM-dependent methyltransferase [Streptomyces sp. NPDC047002]|uniref:class I SAM-dependent methyltransferase n=1 Tax=Streptomyces sp. NPDC047002 TaxID=3155475 RepID=UPI0034555E9E